MALKTFKFPKFRSPSPPPTVRERGSPRGGFPTKQRRYITDRDDLSLPVVSGGVEIGFGYRNLLPWAEDTPLGAWFRLNKLHFPAGNTEGLKTPFCICTSRSAVGELIVGGGAHAHFF